MVEGAGSTRLSAMVSVQATSAGAQWARHRPCRSAPGAPLVARPLPRHSARDPWDMARPTCTPTAADRCRLSCLRSAAAFGRFGAYPKPDGPASLCGSVGLHCTT